MKSKWFGSYQVVILMVLASGTELASATPYTITIQPIQICDDNGQNCSDMSKLGDVKDATTAIYRQADIIPAFSEAVKKINNSNLLNLKPIDDPYMIGHQDCWICVVDDMVNDQITKDKMIGFTDQEIKQDIWDRFGKKIDDPAVLNVWFANSLNDANGDPIAVYGDSFINGNGAMINTRAINGDDTSENLMRLDTVAHEIGHNLGLNHTELLRWTQTTPPEILNLNLMTSGVYKGKDGSIYGRIAPSNLSDITPSGLKLDQLTTDQIYAYKYTDDSGCNRSVNGLRCSQFVKGIVIPDVQTTNQGLRWTDFTGYYNTLDSVFSAIPADGIYLKKLAIDLNPIDKVFYNSTITFSDPSYRSTYTTKTLSENKKLLVIEFNTPFFSLLDTSNLQLGVCKSTETTENCIFTEGIDRSLTGARFTFIYSNGKTTNLQMNNKQNGQDSATLEDLISASFDPTVSQTPTGFSEPMGRMNESPSIPEPGSLALLGIGLAGLGYLRRRKVPLLAAETV